MSGLSAERDRVLPDNKMEWTNAEADAWHRGAQWGMADSATARARETAFAAGRESAIPLVRRAVLDPGAFVKRGPGYDGEPYGERLDQWQDRAIRAALNDDRAEDRRADA